MFFLFNTFSFNEDDDITAKVRKAADDDSAFAALSGEFEKHNRYVASQATGRFITESDDEWSVALIAFYEAVQNYRPDRGSFVSFSDMVIKRRLIDYIRSQSRAARETASDFAAGESASDEEGRFDPAVKVMNEEAGYAAESAEQARDIRSEIEALDAALKDYGISFSDLPDVSPKADKTRRSCAKAIMVVALDKDLRSEMKRKKRLPAKEISKRCGIPLKLLDKHRKYIIAVIEIMTGYYTSLQEFTANTYELAGL